MSFAAVVASFLLSNAFLYHPVHETLWEVQWNAQSDRVEVALRLSALDEQWLEKKYNPAGEKDWQRSVLEKHLFFNPIQLPPSDASTTSDDDKRGTQYRGLPLQWVGRKEEGAHVWWFFEVVCKRGRPPTSVRSTLLFDQERDFRHWITVLGNTVLGNTALGDTALGDTALGVDEPESAASGERQADESVAAASNRSRPTVLTEQRPELKLNLTGAQKGLGR